MNKGCRKTQEALAAGETLSPLEEMHLSCCDGCAAVAESLEALTGDLAALREDVPESLHEQTLKHVTERPTVHRRRFSWGEIGIAVVLFGVISSAGLTFLVTTVQHDQNESVARNVAPRFSLPGSSGEVPEIVSYDPPEVESSESFGDGVFRGLGQDAPASIEAQSPPPPSVAAGPSGPEVWESNDRSDSNIFDDAESPESRVARLQEIKRREAVMSEKRRHAEEHRRAQALTTAERDRLARKERARNEAERLMSAREMSLSSAPRLEPTEAEGHGLQARGRNSVPSMLGEAQEPFEFHTGGFSTWPGYEEEAAELVGPGAAGSIDAKKSVARPAREAQFDDDGINQRGFGDEAGARGPVSQSDSSLVGGAYKQTDARIEDLAQNAPKPSSPPIGKTIAEQVAPVDELNASLQVGAKAKDKELAKRDKGQASGPAFANGWARGNVMPSESELDAVVLSGGKAELKNEASKTQEPAELGLDVLLARLGYGAVDYQPELWKDVTLDHPVYFENLYLGGNARLAYLSSLTEGLPTMAGGRLAHELAQLPVQGLDPPESGGIALHVDLDKVFVPRGAKQRVFVQVGIKGGENLAWRRPPASLAFLPLVGAGNFEAARAIHEELHAGLDGQDKFAAIDSTRSLSFDEVDGPTPELSLPQEQRLPAARALRSLSKAFDAVEKGGAMRNRRLVIVADAELGPRVLSQVHALALKDVAVSVISLNPAHLGSHARVAMDGLGNLQVARDADEARAAARDELASMERVVARALRLNIQAAPGAKFIQVLGSRPLNVKETKRVKAREVAIDKHVERSTGIASDRGADDPGLQTIIPYFQGGDEHVVLVEFEVDGPGPVAEVSLKLKDLVDMKNRTLRQSAALSRTPRGEGQRQARVQRNVLGFAVARVLRELEDGLDAGKSLDLVQLRELSRGLRSAAAASSEATQSLAADREMLSHYLRLLEANASTDALSRSLELARRARLGLSQEEGR